MAVGIPFMEETKMANVQFQKMTTGFGLWSSLSKGKKILLLLLTSNLSFFYSFKLHNKIWLLAFHSPLKEGISYILYMNIMVILYLHRPGVVKTIEVQFDDGFPPGNIGFIYRNKTSDDKSDLKEPQT